MGWVQRDQYLWKAFVEADESLLCSFIELKLRSCGWHQSPLVVLRRICHLSILFPATVGDKRGGTPANSAENDKKVARLHVCLSPGRLMNQKVHVK